VLAGLLTGLHVERGLVDARGTVLVVLDVEPEKPGFLSVAGTRVIAATLVLVPLRAYRIAHLVHRGLPPDRSGQPPAHADGVSLFRPGRAPE